MNVKITFLFCFVFATMNLSIDVLVLIPGNIIIGDNICIIFNEQTSKVDSYDW